MDVAFLPVAVASCFILLSGSPVRGLKCYQCTTVYSPTMPNETEVHLCSKFDQSEKYEVDCPYSTFCMKKTFQLELQYGKVVQGESRNCAAQKRQQQVFKDGKWQMHSSIDEHIYSVGCEQEETHGVKSSTAQYCYCDTNLCNGGESTREPPTIHHTDTMAVIFIFNAIKYIQSLR
ncbi:hypothetical protein LSTR_LSTR006512 [Laodelphax striatellus]|uniref:Protein sleepless n=1 Tax=Laodelphax striatellus TaxID=195883 RepID=A0A482WX92_LAOST|nr:hypothetical protein LSTR_LSTR006512 [Laodelphax striatellus]